MPRSSSVDSRRPAAQRSDMRELPELITASKELLIWSKSIRFDLFIYVIQTDNIIHFRRRGDELTEDDLSCLAKIPPDHVLIPKHQAEDLTGEESTEIDGLALVEGTPIATPRPQAVEKVEIMRPLSTAKLGEKPPGLSAASLISEGSALAEQLFKTAAKGRTLATYEQVLNDWKTEQNPLLKHSRRVSALAVLIQLSTRVDSYQDVTDLAVAGMLHDLGLQRASEPIRMKHFQGDKNLTTSEKLVLVGHVDATIAELQSQKVAVGPTVLRTIQHHHEAWDGSGLKGLRLSQIYRPARILRIADDIVSILEGPRGKGLIEVVKDLSKEMGESEDPIYDPSVLVSLIVDLGASF